LFIAFSHFLNGFTYFDAVAAQKRHAKARSGALTGSTPDLIQWSYGSTSDQVFHRPDRRQDHRRLQIVGLSMILAENRLPLFWIML
jgi:hypothetical protein